jgi:hypothetical protein
VRNNDIIDSANQGWIYRKGCLPTHRPNGTENGICKNGDSVQPDEKCGMSEPHQRIVRVLEEGRVIHHCRPPGIRGLRILLRPLSPLPPHYFPEGPLRCTAKVSVLAIGIKGVAFPGSIYERQRGVVRCIGHSYNFGF